MSFNCLILCRPLLLLPSIFPSIRVFSNESVLHISWPKDWSFSFSISPPNEYSGLISFRIDWFDLLAVQETLKSLLQHHTSKASILQCSAFFIVQLSHPYMTTGKTIALTRQTFVGKVMSLLFNMLSRLFTTFSPRTISKEKYKKAEWLSEEALQIAVNRREAKGKGEKERYTHLNAEFQRTARRDKKAFLSDQCKEIEGNNRMGKTRDLFKKIRDAKGTFRAKMSSIKDRNGMDLTEAEDPHLSFFFF